MQILALADEEYPPFVGCDPARIKGYGIIIACGDLHSSYLDQIADRANTVVFYVNGNHDGKRGSSPPEGCECIDDRLVTFNGVRILGLGGSYYYNSESPYQYTESQMRRRIRRLSLKIKKNKGFDILVTHAPAMGINDGSDIAHRGFESFRQLIDKYSPKYYLHGHVHLNYGGYPRVMTYNNTTVINAYEKYEFEY